MRRGLLLAGVALGALVTWAYLPEARALLLEAAEPLVVPIQRRSTTEEMEQMSRNVVEYERLTGQLPEGPSWLGWLQERYRADATTRDPWGSVYQLVVWDDSVGIVSLGPDRTLSTEDDFRSVARRE